jgi:hypothetical protein
MKQAPPEDRNRTRRIGTFGDSWVAERWYPHEGWVPYNREPVTQEEAERLANIGRNHDRGRGDHQPQG